MRVTEVLSGESRAEHLGTYLLLTSSHRGTDEWETKPRPVGVPITLRSMGEVYRVCDGHHSLPEPVEALVCAWCLHIVGEAEVDGMWMWMEDTRVNGGSTEGQWRVVVRVRGETDDKLKKARTTHVPIVVIAPSLFFLHLQSSSRGFFPSYITNSQHLRLHHFETSSVTCFFTIPLLDTPLFPSFVTLCPS